MKHKKDKKKGKRAIIIILVCSLLVGTVAGAVELFYQGEPEVNDYTETAENPNDEEEMGGSDDESEAVLSSNVKMLTGDEASEVNNAIKSIQNTNQGLIMEIDSDTELSEFGVGDVFYLEGSETTPFRETYIGKISTQDKREDTTTYVLETPTVDEVFDVMKFSYEEVLTADNISEIEAVPGVTVKNMGEDITDNYSVSAATSDEYEISTLSTTTDWTTYDDDPQKLLFEYNLDLLKVFGLDDSENDIKFQEKCSETEGSRVKVYKTETGDCYHRKNCVYLARSEFETTLNEAVTEGYDACYLCNPPLLVKDGVSNFKETLQLVGKLGLSDIEFFMDYDWDILNGNGLNDLYIAARGDFIAEAGLEAKLEYELGGEATTITLPYNTAKLQGLDEKLFPLAFISYNGKLQFSGAGNENIREVTGAVPVTIGVVIYVDINGKASLSGTVTFNYTQSFNYSNQIVKDGEWVLSQETSSDQSTSLKLEAEAKADIEAQLGVSLGLYIYNLNVVELDLGKIGGHAEGTVKTSWSTGDEEEPDNIIDAEYYIRLYYKVLELNIKLKVKVNMLGGSGKLGVDYTYVYLDETIKEWGAKRATKYTEGVMSYTALTAQDENAIYYKNEDGHLVREEDGFRETIYGKTFSTDKEFFSICGIDKSYLYLTVPNDEDSYDIYRVAKEGSTNKKILSDVVNCLCIDETYIYYVSDFDDTDIYKFNRETLTEEKYADMDETVKFMEAQDENFYVVTQEDDFFALFFGGSSSCFLLNAQGVIISNYGTSPEVQNYFLNKEKTFYTAVRQTSSGYLRGTAEEVYWMSSDKSSTVLTEGISGWNYMDIGIFTTQDNNKEDSTPYKIVLYRAEDGSYIDVVYVNSNQAFFTLCQSENGAWYFFDQTENELILYRMNSDFSNKQVVKRFLRDELPCDLDSCSMTIMNNKIYFYTMTDSKTSQMLYRYDVL